MKKGHGFADTPVLQREFWNSHTDHQCVKWKPGSLGWQTSFGRPEWAGQCCSERTWWTDHKQHGKILWLHVDEGKSLPTGRATQKSDKLQWSDWWSFILVWCVMWSYDKTKQTEGQSHKQILLISPEQEERKGLIKQTFPDFYFHYEDRKNGLFWNSNILWHLERYIITGILLCAGFFPLINPIRRKSDLFLFFYIYDQKKWK